MERLTEIAHRLVEVGGVVGVCLGGSRARGTHAPDSDYDLGLYYRRPLDVDGLRRLAAEFDEGSGELTETGGWGPWVDGGGWLTVEGNQVDWIYRDLDRVELIWRDCERGEYEIGFQVGHPLGVYSHSYPGELAVGRILADPAGVLGRLQEAVRVYPEALRRALTERADTEAPFILAGARKGARRGDSAYVAGCVFRAVGVLVHALHAQAGSWLLNEKGAVRAAGELAGAPAGFAERAHGLFALLGTTPESLGHVLDQADRLTAEVRLKFSEDPGLS